MVDNIELFIFDGEDKLASDVIQFEFINNNLEFEFSITFPKDLKISTMYLELTFKSQIKRWRKFDYTWSLLGEERLIANDFSPKIVQLSNGYILVARNNNGCWEYRPKNKSIRWYFYHPMLSPTLTYDEFNKRIFRDHEIICKNIKIESGLLWTQGFAEEWARTPIGFVSTLCFTDHSDFDTLENLIKQREFFKRHGIKTSKGFFLYDYSHKEKTASLDQKDTENELINWQIDGHELLYHAFSQSYRGEISDSEFKHFVSPSELHPIQCYIDHGFHPYNYSMQERENLDTWYSHMESKGISLIWNYVDSGEGNFFCINQLNPNDFRLSNLLDSFRLNNQMGIRRTKKSLVRNLLMFGVSEQVLAISKKFSVSLKQFKQKRKLKYLIKLVEDFFFVLRKVIFSEKKKKLILGRNEIFPFSSFGSVFFSAPNQRHTRLYIFQSISVRDFDVTFSKQALKKLCEEKGLIIAHTYFSFLGNHHQGRLFESENLEVRRTPYNNFSYLGDLIRGRIIWNPTISELFEFYLKTNQIKYELKNNNLVIINFDGVKRFVND